MFNKTFLPILLFGGLLSVFLLFSSGCTGSGKKAKGDFSDCPYGAPQPVFPDSLEAVQHQTFKLGQGRAVEEVIFRNGKKLELIQSGCTTIRQEYRFPIDIRGAMPQTDEHWLRHAANEMEFLAGLSPSHQPLGAWAQLIAAYATEVKVGEPMEVEPGNSFQIDAIRSQEAPMVIVILSRG